MKTRLAMAWMSLLLGWAGTASAVTYYYVNDASTNADQWCSTAGVATNDGLSASSPKLTVSDVISTYVLGAGDVVYIDTGTYSDGFTVTSTDAGDSGGRVTFRGAGKGTVFDKSGTKIEYYRASYVRLSDVTVCGGGTYGIYSRLSPYCEFDRVISRDNGVGFQIGTSGGKPSSYNTLRNCIAAKNTSWGLSSQDSVNTLWENGTIYGGGGGGLQQHVGGNVTIKSSVFHISGSGKYVYTGNVTGDYDVMFVTNGAQVTATYATLDDYRGATGKELHSGQFDPRFADANSYDYHLKSEGARWNGSVWVLDDTTSGAIDFGDPSIAFSLEPSPNGGRINCGAYGNTWQASISADPSVSLIMLEMPGSYGDEPDGGVSYKCWLSKFEVTSAMYRDYLNAAESAGNITVTNGEVRRAASGEVYAWTTTMAAGAELTYTPAGALGSRFTVDSLRVLYPVQYVSWYGAAAFCNWKSEQLSLEEVYTETNGWTATLTASGYRLPTETEWRKAAAWDRTNFIFRVYGQGEDSVSGATANYLHSGDAAETNTVGTLEVGSFAASSPYGLKDMSGNVWEWCHDNFGEDTEDPAASHAVRGGAWGNLPADLKASSRGANLPGQVKNSVGFRVVTTDDPNT